MSDSEIAELVRAAVPDVIAVYRFGSTAGGTVHRGSDVDLAILAPAPLDPVRRFDLQERIAARLGRDVDLVDLRSASTVMRMQVISSGRSLASYDDAAQGAFEDHTFSAYARLNEERRQILQRIAHEGSVHGR